MGHLLTQQDVRNSEREIAYLFDLLDVDGSGWIAVEESAGCCGSSVGCSSLLKGRCIRAFHVRTFDGGDTFVLGGVKLSGGEYP